MMRIVVDRQICAGHALCAARAPDVYRLDADGYCCSDGTLMPEHLAMALHGKSMHYRLGEIHAHHWKKLVQFSGLPHLWDQLIALATGVDATLRRVQTRLPAGFPAVVGEAVEAGVRMHAVQFLREIELLSSNA